MNDSDFRNLMEGLNEALAVERGQAEPVRVHHDPDPDARAVRESLRLTRQQFSAVLGVSERTVEGWEQGRRRPQGAARMLLKVAHRAPEVVLEAAHPTLRDGR